MAIAIMGYICLVDFPDRSTFLSAEQKAMVVERIHRDRGDSVADPMTMKKFISYLLEPKIWLFAIWFCITTLGTYAMSYFLPRILSKGECRNISGGLLELVWQSATHAPTFAPPRGVAS